MLLATTLAADPPAKGSRRPSPPPSRLRPSCIRSMSPIKFRFVLLLPDSLPCFFNNCLTAGLAASDKDAELVPCAIVEPLLF